MMKSILDANDRHFLDRLHRLGSATVQELCEELAVTATAVRQRLTRLLSLGLVSRAVVRAGRGRPHYTYAATEAGLRELGDNYADLAMILWHELQNIEEPTVRKQVVQRIEQALVERYGTVVAGRSLHDRMERLTSQLSERGFDMEVDSSGRLPILRENNCPYPELAGEDSRICELEQAVFSRVLGRDMNLTQCCLEGHACCEFQPAEETDGSIET